VCLYYDNEEGMGWGGYIGITVFIELKKWMVFAFGEERQQHIGLSWLCTQQWKYNGYLLKVHH